MRGARIASGRRGPRNERAENRGAAIPGREEGKGKPLERRGGGGGGGGRRGEVESFPGRMDLGYVADTGKGNTTRKQRGVRR